MTDAALRSGQAAEAWTSFVLRGGPTVAAEARALTESLRSRLGEDASADLALMLSELVTNSYRHSGAGSEGIDVEVEIANGRVRAEIRDHGPGFKPEPVPEVERGEGGWGLYIVDRLAHRWGVRAGPPSCVWFEIER